MSERKEKQISDNEERKKKQIQEYIALNKLFDTLEPFDDNTRANLLKAARDFFGVSLGDQ